jgi:hypothetical protein
MTLNGLRRTFVGSSLVACLAVSSLPSKETFSTIPPPPAFWTTVDFKTATCGYASPIPLTFSVPPGYVVRNPNHGVEIGCLWGTAEDLARALGSPAQINFEQLDRGIFQARLTNNVSYDVTSHKFVEEDQLEPAFADAGVTNARVKRRTFAGHPALVVTGQRSDGFDLYMLYLARGTDPSVIAINYRPATPSTPLDSATWQQFLEAIR